MSDSKAPTRAGRRKFLALVGLPLALAVVPASVCLIYAESAAPWRDSAPSAARPTTQPTSLAAPRVSAIPSRFEEPTLRANDSRFSEEAAIRELRELAEQDAFSALTLANEQARSFPKGEHAEEREEIAIRALFRLDRISEARARAESFLTEHRRGPVADRVAALSGVHVIR